MTNWWKLLTFSAVPFMWSGRITSVSCGVGSVSLNCSIVSPPYIRSASILSLVSATLKNRIFLMNCVSHLYHSRAASSRSAAGENGAIFRFCLIPDSSFALSPIVHDPRRQYNVLEIINGVLCVHCMLCLTLAMSQNCWRRRYQSASTPTR